MKEKVIDFVKKMSGLWLEPPRKQFFGGPSLKAKRFKLSFKPETNKIYFKFEKGSTLGIEAWRISEAIEFLKGKRVVGIGARISEDYPINSLEGHLKEKAKKKYKRSTDTKTAPHIVDLLVLGGFAELGYVKSYSGRRVQGVRLIQ